MSGQPRSLARQGNDSLRIRADEGSLEDMIQRVGLSGQYNDFTLYCGSRAWPVHKLVLGPRSEHFKIAFDGAYKDQDAMILTGVTPEIVDRMVKFVYSTDYDDEPQDESEKALSVGANVLINARVYTLAERYQIPALETRVIEKMHLALATGWNSMNLFKAIALIWELTSRSAPIRKQLLACMASHRIELFRKPDFRALMVRDGQIAVDFMLAVHDTPNTTNNVTMLWCATPGCQKEQHIRCAICNRANNLSFISRDDLV